MANQIINLYLNWMGILSETNSLSVLIPTNRGLPRRVATHCPGNFRDLNVQANAPSSWRMAFSANSRKSFLGYI